MGLFSEIIEYRRREIGFKTPYSFYLYKRNRLDLKCSYRHYLDIEQGKSLPGPGILTNIMKVLEFENSEELLKSAVWSYLHDYFDGNLMLQNLFKLDLKKDDADITAAMEKEKAHFKGATVFTRKQLGIMLRSYQHYIVAFLYFIEGRRLSWRISEISKKFDIPAGRVEKVFLDFKKGGLIVHVSGDRYRSKAKKVFFPEASSTDLVKWVGYEEEFMKTWSREHYYSSGMITSSSDRMGEFISYLPMVELALRLYGVITKSCV